MKENEPRELEDGRTVLVAQAAEMITERGSVYRVLEDTEGRWWLNADNVPNPRSVRLEPTRWWRIRRPEPWPPKLGHPVELMAPDGCRAAGSAPRR